MTGGHTWDEAVEAVVRSLSGWSKDQYDRWHWLPTGQGWKNKAEAVLAAAVPLIREQIATEIEAERAEQTDAADYFEVSVDPEVRETRRKPRREFTEWAVRYPAEHCSDGYGYQMCDDEAQARDWQRYLPRPSDVVCCIVTRSHWSVAAAVSPVPDGSTE